MTSFVDAVEPAGLAEFYLGDERPPPPSRPWVTIAMISSLDGAVTVEGRSSRLGGEADRAAFRALRAVADVVLVGATTARTERYRAVDLPADLVAWRRSKDMADNPRIAIVSASLDLDPTPELAASRPWVVTVEAAEPVRMASLGWAEILQAGHGRVDLVDALGELRRRGVRRVTLEGGPDLNGQMIEQGLVDEVCLTVSPVMVSGVSGRIVSGRELWRDVSPERVIQSDGFLLLRYLTH